MTQEARDHEFNGYIPVGLSWFYRLYVPSLYRTCPNDIRYSYNYATFLCRFVYNEIIIGHLEKVCFDRFSSQPNDSVQITD